MRVTVNDTTEVIDLKASTLSELTLDWSASQPHGKYTRIPSFSPGLYVRTSLIVQAGQSFADVSYRYAHQESAPETGTVVRLYEENTRSQWRLADTVTFLGASGLPVRLAEFRRQNPETVSEHARSVARGDKRTYEQWLDTHLTMHPEELTRPGILHADVSLSSVDAARVSTRRIPLPAHAGRLQASVMPGTLTKSGPEYFGLPFTPTALLSGRSAKASVEIEPTATASETGPPYGRLKLRLRFPPNRWPQSEPLLTTGVNEAGDILYVIYLDKEHIRIGFDHWFKGGPVTPPIPLDFAREHEVEISLGSLFPPRDDVVFAGVPPASVDELKNRVVVKLDGETVLDAVAECYESPLSEIRVGTNSIRATTTGPLFNGELISMERIWPWPE